MEDPSPELLGEGTFGTVTRRCWKGFPDYEIAVKRPVQVSHPRP